MAEFINNCTFECHPNATCTPQGCECDKPFIGNGIMCFNCERCSENALCLHPLGCTCPAGSYDNPYKRCKRDYDLCVTITVWLLVAEVVIIMLAVVLKCRNRRRYAPSVVINLAPSIPKSTSHSKQGMSPLLPFRTGDSVGLVTSNFWRSVSSSGNKLPADEKIEKSPKVPRTSKKSNIKSTQRSTYSMTHQSTKQSNRQSQHYSIKQAAVEQKLKDAMTNLELKQPERQLPNKNNDYNAMIFAMSNPAIIDALRNPEIVNVLKQYYLSDRKTPLSHAELNRLITAICHAPHHEKLHDAPQPFPKDYTTMSYLLSNPVIAEALKDTSVLDVLEQLDLSNRTTPLSQFELNILSSALNKTNMKNLNGNTRQTDSTTMQNAMANPIIQHALKNPDIVTVLNEFTISDRKTALAHAELYKLPNALKTHATETKEEDANQAAGAAMAASCLPLKDVIEDQGIIFSNIDDDSDKSLNTDDILAKLVKTLLNPKKQVTKSNVAKKAERYTELTNKIDDVEGGAKAAVGEKKETGPQGIQQTDTGDADDDMMPVVQVKPRTKKPAEKRRRQREPVNNDTTASLSKSRSRPHRKKSAESSGERGGSGSPKKKRQPENAKSNLALPGIGGNRRTPSATSLLHPSPHMVHNPGKKKVKRSNSQATSTRSKKKKNLAQQQMLQGDENGSKPSPEGTVMGSSTPCEEGVSPSMQVADIPRDEKTALADGSNATATPQPSPTSAANTLRVAASTAAPVPKYQSVAKSALQLMSLGSETESSTFNIATQRTLPTCSMAAISRYRDASQATNNPILQQMIENNKPSDDTVLDSSFSADQSKCPTTYGQPLAPATGVKKMPPPAAKPPSLPPGKKSCVHPANSSSEEIMEVKMLKAKLKEIAEPKRESPLFERKTRSSPTIFSDE